jgi:hypothetical protein
MNESKFQLLKIGGVWPFLYSVSGWAAEERGSETIEPLDLVKAIYIVDLEHVSAFWNTWEGFERFVAGITLDNGQPMGYVNRTIYLIQNFLSVKDNPGTFISLGRPSEGIHRVVAAAAELASKREGSAAAPTSGDLLFCACLDDTELADGLRQSGLQLSKLEAAVKADKS